MNTLVLTEAQFQEKVTTRARARGWLVYHTYDSRRSAPGFPDLVLARDGRVMFVELKASSGRISAAQREWLTALGATDPAGNVSNPFRMTATADGSALSVEIWRPNQWHLITELLQ